jgi:hypothetical protein
MKLHEWIDFAFESYVQEEVEKRLQQIRLDASRLGGDVVNLANELSNVVQGLKNHKEVLESIMRDQQKFAIALQTKPSPPFPPLHKGPPVGPI